MTANTWIWLVAAGIWIGVVLDATRNMWRADWRHQQWRQR